MQTAFTTVSQPQLEDALKHHFGYQTFRSGQLEIIQQLFLGKDSLVLMPTGGGKSMCYQLPAVLLPGVTIVVSPLIALMKDQVDGLTRQGISAAFINSSLEQETINLSKKSEVFFSCIQSLTKCSYTTEFNIKNS